MKRIVFDTNFLMLPHTHGIDIFGELEKLFPEAHEVVVPSPVLRELEELGKSNRRQGVAARTAIELMKRRKIKTVENSKKADESILDIAGNKNTVVCTNDGELKRMLRENHIPVVCMRNKSGLILI